MERRHMMWSRVPLLSAALLGLVSCHGTRPDIVGRGLDGIAPCPSTPNCVSTYASDSAHAIAPITFQGEADEAMERLVAVVNNMERTEIVTRSDRYLYVEFTTKVWRFVDDVEFVVDDSSSTIQFRSASRLGKSDLGVNRDRMEEVRRRFSLSETQ